MGKAYLNLDEPNRALQCFEQMPKSPDSNNYIGCAYFDMKDFTNATLYFEKAIELNPNESSYFMNNGDSLMNLSRFEDAFNMYSKVIELEPENTEALALRDRALFEANKTGSVQNINEFCKFWKASDLTSNPSNDLDANAYVCKGLALSYERNFTEAIHFYDKAIEIDPNNAEAFNYKGTSLLDIGCYREALDTFGIASKLEPSNVDYLMNIGHSYCFMEKLDEAVKIYKKAFELDTTSIKALESLGITYFDLGNYNESLMCFNKILEIDPNNTGAYNYKG